MSAARAESPSPMTWLSYLVLLSLADGPTHGYGMIKEVESRTGGRTRIEAGTLYAAIKRLRERQLLRPVSDASSWKVFSGHERSRELIHAVDRCVTSSHARLSRSSFFVLRARSISVR